MRTIVYGVLVVLGLVAAVAGGWYAGRQSALATQHEQAVMGRAAAVVTVNGHPLYDREMLMIAPPAHTHHERMHDRGWKYEAVAGVKSFVRDTLITTAVGILLLALLLWLRRPAARGTSDPPSGA